MAIWYWTATGRWSCLKLPLTVLVCTAAIAARSPPGHAQRQTAVGPGNIPLSAAGGLNGVDMSVSGITGTLIVGVPGGPQTDIFSGNNPPGAGLLAVSTAASSQGNIVFNSGSTVFGAIGVTQPGGPFLLAITGGNTGTVVNFLGPVFATTLNVSGTGAVNFNSGTTNVTATNFAADGVIGLAPNTTVIGALTTTAGARTGTLALGGASVLDGAVGGAIGLRAINVVGGSNLAGVTATITGAANAYSFALGTNTLNIGGALTIANGGTGGSIATTLASPTLYGNIRPVGATNLGPSLLINVTVPSTTFIPVGSRFNIVQTASGTLQSGTNGSLVVVTVVDPTNPLYRFAAVPLAGTIAGQVTIETTAIPLLVPIAPAPGVVLPPALPIAATIVPVLLAIPLPPVLLTNVSPSDLFTNVLPAINALSDPAQVVNAIVQFAPSAAALAAPSVTFQMTRAFQDVGLSRLNDTLCSQVRRQPDGENLTCRDLAPRTGLWIKGFGQTMTQGAQGAFAGYDAGILGTMIGYDVPLGADTRVGVALGVGRGNINSKSFNANASFNSYDGMIYVGHQSGPWFVNGDVSIGWNEYSGDRHISFPGFDRLAKSNYSGQDYTAFGTTGYHFFARGFVFTPLASLQYTHMDLSGYAESGAGDIGLRVNAQSYDFLESGLGVKVAYPITYGTGTYVPELHAMWFHELNNPAIRNAAAFNAAGSGTFTTSGAKTADDMFNVGTRLTILSCECKANTWSLEAAYDYYWSSEQYSAHRGMLRFVSHF